ncbi:hypothetical protein C1645_783718 [Glomus cerebriforme]|uniref:BZIP domain-containing protein n=1 Tax=Glomus cerebriforme TaxID=658196 RepID=A0A397SKK0_9GLOM|nr:hypothetical protein C1645_783718 [Glomus cerebriforme]
MTNQKKGPDNTVSSITFFNPSYNSQQTSAANLRQQPHLQQTAAQTATSYFSQQSISHAPHNTTGTFMGEDLSHHIHHTMQALPSSSVHLQQQIPSQFQIFYSAVPLQNPQFTIIPSLTSDVKRADFVSSPDVKCANVASSTSPTVKCTNVVSSPPSPSPSTSTSSSSKSLRGTKVLSDDKRVQRLVRNRIAARECRERKKAYISSLESKASRLEDDNLILRKKVQELETKLEWAESKNQENIKLEKLVKKLKEKMKRVSNDVIEDY